VRNAIWYHHHHHHHHQQQQQGFKKGNMTLRGWRNSTYHYDDPEDENVQWMELTRKCRWGGGLLIPVELPGGRLGSIA